MCSLLQFDRKLLLVLVERCKVFVDTRLKFMTINLHTIFKTINHVYYDLYLKLKILLSTSSIYRSL